MRTPAEYRESLRDGCRVSYRGGAVDDVPSHEVFRHAINHAALDYQMAENPAYRDLAVKDGYYSRYFYTPENAELLAIGHLIEAATRAGRTPALLIKEIGSDALFALMAMRNRLGTPHTERSAINRGRHGGDSMEGVVAVGDTVAVGDKVAILESLKLEIPDTSARLWDGRNDRIGVTEDQTVREGTMLLTFRSFYMHFNSKDDLLYAILKRGHNYCRYDRH